ncbi:MAG: S8 family serine peptidase [Chloroflexi bacterium]|nr:S8 family serine peptidase [Chloroflexota bacterium]
MLVLSAQPLYAAGPGAEQVGKGQRMIVGLEDTQKLDWLYDLSRRTGIQIIRIDEKLKFAVVEVPAVTARAAQAEITENPDVRFLEPDGRVSIVLTPDDPDYNNLSLVYGPQLMNAPVAWDYTLGDPSVIIGIIDTGLDASHPEFAGRIVPGWDFVNNDSDPSDDHGHGTHVSGIATAGINNGIGMVGIAGRASLLPVKVLDSTGSGWWSNVASGITWAVDQGARVINLSLGGSADSTVLRDAVNYATANNAVVVVAAGNSGTDTPFYPAVYDNVISVGAVTSTGDLATYSNYGPNVDVVAPGSSIYSTEWAGTGRTYGFRSGTSMASPHVAGLAALMLSVNPALTESEVRTLIESNTQAADPQVIDYYTGHGLVDAGAAVAAALPLPGGTGLLQGVAFYDWNENGVQDTAEQGIENIQVCLYQDAPTLGVLDTADTLLSCVNTGLNGLYEFSQLQDGDYLVVETLPADFMVTTPTIYGTTISGGVSSLANGALDFGNLVYSAVTGVIYIDSNGNGVHDTNETIGIANVLVTLTNLDTFDSVTVLSDSAGAYTFDSLVPGTYTLKTPSLIPGFTPTGPTTQEVTVGIDEVVSDASVGYINPTNISLASFTVQQSSQGIKLNWTTARETNQTGFIVWRSLGADGTYKPVSPLIQAENNEMGASYQWIDISVEGDGSYWYKLESVPDGEFFGPIFSGYSLPQPETTSTIFAPFIMR